MLCSVFVGHWDCVSVAQPWLKQYFEHHDLSKFPWSLKVDHEKTAPVRDDDTGEIYVQSVFFAIVRHAVVMRSLSNFEFD